MKTAIVVLSDPAGGEEALGRLFNALGAAYDFKQRKAEVAILFMGAGTRWTSHVTRKDHPANAIYQAVADSVAGASCGCADVFGCRMDVERDGFELLQDNAVPGTSGLPSLAGYAARGWSLLTF